MHEMIDFFNINTNDYETPKLLFLNFNCCRPCACCLWIITALKRFWAGLAGQ
jgi:hypothetical protein